MGKIISPPAVSISAVLGRAQLLVMELLFTENNLLQQFLFLRLCVERNNRLGQARAAPSSLQLVLHPSNNDFRVNNSICWFTALISRRSLQLFGTLTTRFLPSLNSAFHPT